MSGILILDTKLLVLLIVGMTSTSYINKHKRLRPYTEADFDLLSGLIRGSRGLIVTPNTVTEASNFAGYIDNPARSHIFDRLHWLVSNVEEDYLPSRTASEDRAFRRLGITDSVLLKLPDSNHILLTDDIALYVEAANRGVRAINFTHLRSEAGIV